MSNPDYRPRLNIDITEEQQQILGKYFEHGEQKIVFNVIIGELVDLLEKHGRIIISLIGTRYTRASEIIPSLNAAEEGAKRLKGE